MSILLTKELKSRLQELKISTFLNIGSQLPDSILLEPPCSLKWMSIQHSLKMGAYSYAVSGYYFACEIGRYCSIGENIQIGRHAHAMHWVSTSPFFQMEIEKVLDLANPVGPIFKPSTDFHKSTNATQLKRTIIGNDVWIGHGAFIMPGVKVGNGAVIGAMSVVTKDVVPYSVVGGSPARLLKYRFSQEHIDLLENSKWWSFDPWALKGATIDNIEAFVKFVEKLSHPILEKNYIDIKNLSTQMKCEKNEK